MLILKLSKLNYQTTEYMVCPSDLSPVNLKCIPFWEVRVAREKEWLQKTKGAEAPLLTALLSQTEVSGQSMGRSGGRE